MKEKLGELRRLVGRQRQRAVIDVRQNSAVLVIVPGDRTVTARCDSCWRYGDPRDFAEVRLGGHKNAYSGTCAGEGS